MQINQHSIVFVLFIVIIIVVMRSEYFRTPTNIEDEHALQNIPKIKEISRSVSIQNTEPPNQEKAIERIESNSKPELSQSNSPNKIIAEKPESNKSKIVNALEIIRRDCGELCDTSRPGSPGPYFNHVTANIDCTALFNNEFIDSTHELKYAPKVIPPELMKYFTMDGKIKVTKWYFDEPYLEKKVRTPVWTYTQIENWKKAAREGKLYGNYGTSETNALRDGLQHAPGIINGRVLVIGSQTPWVEAVVLESGAREIVTLEYGEIVSEHPQIKTLTPMQFRKDYLAGQLGMFDAVVTFSSVEHSGLGRYGDALNPWGDIIAIARAWCVTKKGGSLTIGVLYCYDNDAIRFNADRCYGKIRYPYLVTNWNQFYRGAGAQRVHVFTNGFVNNASFLRT